MSTFIYSHNPGSEGAKALKNALGIKAIKHEGSKFKASQKKTVINWGSSNLPDLVKGCNILNPHTATRKVTDKLECFKAMADLPIAKNVPDWTTSPAVALQWIADGEEVMARKILNGHSGEGIVHIDKNAPEGFNLPKAPLYVKYIPKTEEYRIHVVNGKVVDYQRKTLSKDFQANLKEGEEINWKVRNLANGFIYQRDGVNPTEETKAAAIGAVTGLGLHFGAVDIVVHTKTKVPYILEINSAPGLQGQTVTNYANALKELL